MLCLDIFFGKKKVYKTLKSYFIFSQCYLAALKKVGNTFTQLKSIKIVYKNAGLHDSIKDRNGRNKDQMPSTERKKQRVREMNIYI